MRISIDDMAISQLFETLLWQATDWEGEPLDTKGVTRSDIERESQETLISEFRAFVETNSVDIDAFMFHTGCGMVDVAHDFILTRNGHGAGFWDRCYCGIDQSDAPAQRLTEMSKAFGTAEVFESDSGWYHIL